MDDLTEKKRVLHVIDHLVPASGVCTVVMNVVRFLDGFHQDVAVYGKIAPELEKIVRERGGQVFRLPDVTLKFGKPFGQAFEKLLRENSFQIVHGHLLNSAFIYMRIAKKIGVPLRIIHSHSAKTSNTALKRLRNNVLIMGVPFWANKFIACTENAVYGERSEIVPLAIDTARFKYEEKIRAEVRDELGISGFCVGNVARFSKEKNYEFLVEIAKRLPDTTFICVGDGALFEYIMSTAPKNMIFTGARKDPERIYQALDAFVMPSFFEGFGLTAVEAQCSGISCLLSDTIPRIVNCGLAHYLPLGDVKKWVKAVENLSKTQQNNRENGVQLVMDRGLAVEEMADKIRNIYMRGLNNV